MGEGSPTTATYIASAKAVSIPGQKRDLVVVKPKDAEAQKKGAQPLRVVGRQKRVVFARVPGGKPARANHIFG
jgi:hypothetical protein